MHHSVFGYAAVRRSQASPNSVCTTPYTPPLPSPPASPYLASCQLWEVVARDHIVHERVRHLMGQLRRVQDPLRCLVHCQQRACETTNKRNTADGARHRYEASRNTLAQEVPNRQFTI